MNKSDKKKTKPELLYELRLLRLENLRLQEKSSQVKENFPQMRQLRYLENISMICEIIRHTTDLDEMMNDLMEVVRSIFNCDQAWLLHPCDPQAQHWRVPFRSTTSEYPIHFGPCDDLPVTPDLAENCRLALSSLEPIPLGSEELVKNVPEEAGESAARSALLISLQPKIGRPWLLGLHQCTAERIWSAEEKRLYQDISGRITDALSTTLFYQNLEQNQRRLKHLSGQLFRTQEDERRRIAEEIHDELGQPTLAIKMGVENAIFQIDDDSASAKLSLKSIAKLARDMVQKMRRMQTSLYPPALNDFGVISALNEFLTDYTHIYTHLDIQLDIHIQEKAIPVELRVTVFRVAQEALHNAAKHSSADRVIVRLDEIDSRLSLEILDNGIGFAIEETIRYPDKRLGLGLTSMRERTELSQGSFEVESTPGYGTTIRAIWPLCKEGQAGMGK